MHCRIANTFDQCVYLIEMYLLNCEYLVRYGDETVRSKINYSFGRIRRIRNFENQIPIVNRGVLISRTRDSSSDCVGCFSDVEQRSFRYSTREIKS